MKYKLFHSDSLFNKLDIHNLHMFKCPEFFNVSLTVATLRYKNIVSLLLLQICHHLPCSQLRYPYARFTLHYGMYHVQTLLLKIHSIEMKVVDCRSDVHNESLIFST